MRRLEYQSRRVGVVERANGGFAPRGRGQTLPSGHLDASEEAESRRLTVFALAARDSCSPVRSGGGELKA